MRNDRELLSLMQFLEDDMRDLRCRNVPTGGDDYEVQWFVTEPHMSEPNDREIGAGRTALEALLNAFRR